MDIEEIESILNCPICMDELNDPRILPCQHSFCEKCLSSYIKDLVKAKQFKKSTFPCPICRNKTKLRNDLNDASCFERDLTKVALLESKHILLVTDDNSSDDGSTCKPQSMSTQTDNSHDVTGTDLNDNLDVPILGLSGDDSKNENRKTPKRNRKRALSSRGKNKEKASNNTKKNRNRQKTKENTDLNQGRSTELEFMDYILVSFILVPLYTLSWKDINKYIFVAFFLVIILSLIVLGFTYMAPYISIFFFCFWLVSFYRGNREIISSHCNMAVVRYHQILLMCHFQYSICLAFFFFCLYFFVFAVSCKLTLTNALWKNDSIVSVREWEHNFITYGYSWLDYIHVLNIRVYELMRKMVNLIFF